MPAAGRSLMPRATVVLLLIGTIAAAGRGAEPSAAVDVFVAGHGGYHTYRIPALVATGRHVLLAVCEGRKNNRADHGDIDLVLRRSLDNGATWQPMQLVYEEGGTQSVTIGNPCPVVDRVSGRVWLPFTRDNDSVLVTYSDDDGQSWSAPRDITQSVKHPDWTWYATGPGAGIQMAGGPHAGRLVIPCDHREPIDGRPIKHSHVFYSDDHGETWRLGGTVAPYTDECQVVEFAPGKLMINMRNYWGREAGAAERAAMRAVATSEDGGQSWSELRFDPVLIEPVCQASIIAYDGPGEARPWLLFSNPASRTARRRLTVRGSRDQGKTWPAEVVAHVGPAAYSCLVTLPGRAVGCLYECGEKQPYERIAFQRLSAASFAP